MHGGQLQGEITSEVVFFEIYCIIYNNQLQQLAVLLAVNSSSVAEFKPLHGAQKLQAYMQKTCDVAEEAILAKKWGKTA